jgi:hypothetical protein
MVIEKMKSLYKHIIVCTAIALVVAVTLYEKKYAKNNKESYSPIKSAESSNRNGEKNYATSSATLTSSDSSSSLQSAETLSINSEVKKPEAITEKDEKINRVEKQDDELTEEELEKRKRALVKKYSSQLPTIYNNRKFFGENVVGSPLSHMKKIADTGDTAAKINYASALTRDFWHNRFDIKPEEVEQWKLRFKESFDYYRSAAIDGDAMAAACLGCDYFLPPYSDNLEGITWVLISVKLGALPCIDRMPSDEKLYVQALEQAKFYLDYYKFKTEN